MKKLLAALLALLCLPVMTALGDTQGDFTYALTPEGAVAASTEPWFRERVYTKLNRRLAEFIRRETRG